MSKRRVRESWIEQFVARDDVTNPFVQVVFSAQLLGRVAEDRLGLNRRDYEAAEQVRRQALVFEELARSLDDEVAAHGRRADDALSAGLEPGLRGRVLSMALAGSVRAHATLLEACTALLNLAEGLLVVRRPHSRLLLMSAIEGVRSAASTAHLTLLVNLHRITDVTLYDDLAQGAENFDATLAQANRVTSALRSEVSVGLEMPLRAETAAHGSTPGGVS